MRDMTKAADSHAVRSAPPPALTISVRVGQGRAAIRLGGEIDLGTAREVREVLLECHRVGATTLAVDMAGVTYCGTTGLRVFLAADRRAAADGGALQLLNPCVSLSRVMRITRTSWLLLADGLSGPADGLSGHADRLSPHADQVAGSISGNQLPPARRRTPATAGEGSTPPAPFGGSPLWQPS